MEQPWFPPNASPCPQSAWRLPNGDAALNLVRLSLIRSFAFTHYPTHRSGIRIQSRGLISPRRRYAPLLEML
ncbi:hypothetical protein FIC94_08010 [Ochrobactrum teleogrylli]|uniref:Uncharacterized protein n=1 Tax=Ochrobactrum teleogrylli TaxID=2479765 RepID=A0ABY2Y8R0_9HYPH|nr:hypothetical protein FIC94_08010 [[Ochrobactrum] teleogrylli]